MSKKKKNNKQPDIKGTKQKALPAHSQIKKKELLTEHRNNNDVIRYYEYAFLLVLFVLAIFLRFYDIGTEDVWIDEANSVIIAGQHPSGIISRLINDGSPPLFYFILHYWMSAFGTTEIALRSLSALFGILLVIAVYLTGKNIFSPKVGIYAALICSFAPIQIMYSQQIRMYTLLPLVSLLSMYYLLRFIKENKKLMLVWYGIFAILCLYTHNHGILLLPAHAMLIIFLVRQRQMIFYWLLSIMFVGVIYSFWLPSLLHQMGNDPSRWMERFWNYYGFGGSIYMSLSSFAPGGAQPPYVPLNSLRWMPILPVLIIFLLLIFSMIPLFSNKRSNWKTEIGGLIIYLFIPLFSAGIISLLFSCIYIPGRTDQLVFPAFCLLCAIGIQQIRPPFLKHVAVILILICSFLTLYDYYRINSKQGDRIIAQIIKEHLIPGDTIICTSKTRASLEYYLRNEKPSPRIYSYPLENALHLCRENIPKLLKNPAKLTEEADIIFNEAKNFSTSGRCFVLYVDNEVNQFLAKKFNTNLPVNQIMKIGSFQQSLLNNTVNIFLVRF